MNCFEPSFRILTGHRGFNDYMQIHIFACNYVGFTLSLMGYGISASIRIYDPTKRSKSDSKETCGKTDGQQHNSEEI